MLCSSWIAGSATFAESDNPVEETSSAFYLQNEWAFFVENVQDEDETEKDRSICVMFEHDLNQIVAINPYGRAVVLDNTGCAFVWDPSRQRGPLSITDAIHSGCVIRLPTIENIPIVKIVDSKGPVFVLQHEARLYFSIFHIDGLSKGVYLEDVKADGISISPRKNWLAVCSRRELRDTVTIYAIAASEPVKTSSGIQTSTRVSVLSRWTVPRLSRRYPCGDIRKIRWCVEEKEEDISDAFIALVDNALYDVVYIYRALDGSLVRCVSNDPSVHGITSTTMKDALDETTSASNNRSEKELDLLGVSSIDFRSRLICVVDHSSSIRIYGDSNNYLRPLAVLPHPHVVFAPTKFGAEEILVFREYTTRIEGEDLSAFNGSTLGAGEKYRPPALPNTIQDENQLAAIKTAKLSFDCTYLASVSAASPNVIWIWNLESVQNARLHALVELSHPVQMIMWSPKANSLAAIGNSKAIYLWEPRGCAAARIPSGSSRPAKLTWDTTGISFIVSSRPTLPTEPEMFCFCNLAGSD